MLICTNSNSHPYKCNPYHRKSDQFVRPSYAYMKHIAGNDIREGDEHCEYDSNNNKGVFSSYKNSVYSLQNVTFPLLT